MPPSKNPAADAGAQEPGNSGDNTSQGEERKGPSILVRSVSEKGRRRAGHAFGPEPKRIFLEDLTKEQKEAIRDDKHLISRLFDDD
ncbi:MAG: hypothetical protein KGJ57_18200 [Sphingomonadales bacterium]|nr:hypothetical protein [Sphingomonadales bacterium]MDE2171331.1 hypothetical protein [Sphingomonadales bacterium]